MSSATAVSALREALTSGGIKPIDCGFFFDFDGTLAPIQDDPVTVRPVPGLLPRLRALQDTGATVAVVSARPVAFLREAFKGLDGVRLFGLYGLEQDLGGTEIEIHSSARPYLDVMRELARRAAVELPAGTGVEDKRLTVALHYRRHPELAEQVRQWSEERAAQYGLRVQQGRMVYELKPPGGRSKGSVLGEETDALRVAWYFGDDLGDIPAFEELGRLILERPGFRAVRVVVANPETGDAVAQYADIHLPGPADVPDLLDHVLAALAPVF